MRLRELLLPLLLLPMILPALISCVEATGLVLDNKWGEALYPPLKNARRICDGLYRTFSYAL